MLVAEYRNPWPMHMNGLLGQRYHGAWTGSKGKEPARGHVTKSRSTWNASKQYVQKACKERGGVSHSTFARRSEVG